MDEEAIKQINQNLSALSYKLDNLHELIDARIDKIKAVIMAYLEAGSSISLASVKANLKSV